MAFLYPKEYSVVARSADARFNLVSQSENDGLPVRNLLSVRDTKSGKVMCALERNDIKLLHSAFFSPGNDKVAMLEIPGIPGLEWFDTTTGKQLGKFPDANCWGLPAFSPDGRLLAWLTKGQPGQSLFMADATSGRLLRPLGSVALNDLEGDDRAYAMLAFSRDSTYLAVSSIVHWGHGNGKPVPIRVVHVQSGKQIASFFVHREDAGMSDAPTAIAFSPDGRLLAVAEDKTSLIRVLEIKSGRTRLALSGHRFTPMTLAFTPDGNMLASGGYDNVIYLWDLTGARTKPTGKDLEPSVYWEALGGLDAVRVGEAMAALVRQPDRSLAFLKEKLGPVTIEEKHLKQLIADLDSDAFEKRETASRELSQLGEIAETALRLALKNSPTAETKRRINELLEKLDSHSLPPGTLQALRAVEALEHIGTSEAQRLLAVIANGAAEARLTRDAKSSLQRLNMK